MKLHVWEIPESLHEKRAWLDQRLVSTDFHDFLLQLNGLNDSRQNPQPVELANWGLEHIVGEDRDKILSNGCQILSERQVHQLLNSPNALCELQESIYVECTPYWQNMIANSVESPFPEVATDARLTDNEHRNILTGSPSKISRKTAIGLSTIAASVLVVLLVWYWGQVEDTAPQASGWGWQRADWFDSADTKEKYVTRLIDGARAWFAKPVESPRSYLKRLNELSEGCQSMIDAEHDLLSTKERNRLVALCKRWQEKFIAQYETVDRDPTQFESMKRETDQTIELAIERIPSILES